MLTLREEKKEGKSASQGGDQDADKVSLTCIEAHGLTSCCCCLPVKAWVNAFSSRNVFPSIS